jgi:hypothetical protein
MECLAFAYVHVPLRAFFETIYFLGSTFIACTIALPDQVHLALMSLAFP